MLLRDEHGAIIGIFGISRDISQLKQTEQELRQYREHLEALVAERTSALTQSNTVQELRQYREHLEALVAERTSALTQSNTLLNDEVFERGRIEQVLRASEAQYRLLAENVRDGIVIIQQHALVSANAAFMMMTGYPPEQIYSSDPTRLFHNRAALIAHTQLTTGTQDGLDPRWQAELITKDGRTLWAEIEQASIIWTGQPALILTIRDITDRKLLEQRLEEERARI
jgi:PAS domain S-box-containing protein